MRPPFQIILLAANALIALGLAALVPSSIGLAVVRTSGAWIIAQLFLLWALVAGWSLYARRDHWRTWRPQWGELGLIVGASLFVISRDPVGFKVTMDELMLAATAMSLHFGRSPEAITRGYELQGVFEAVVKSL